MREIIKGPERSPATWSILIRAMPTHLQAPVASLVWWDHFSQRISAKRWPHLDDLIRRPHVEPPQEELIEALVGLGYGRRYIKTRLARSRYSEERTQFYHRHQRRENNLQITSFTAA